MIYNVDGSDITSVANAIRTKGGTSSGLSFPDGFVSAIGNIPTGGGATLIAKSISENGTYSANDDDADGYSSVSVSVAPKFVTGTFKGLTSEKGTAKSVTIPYTGNGYPIAGIIYPAEGGWNSESDFYSKVQRYIIGSIAFAKSNTQIAPSYSESENTEKNWAFAYSMFKNSDSDATNFNRNGYVNQRTFRQNAATAAAVDCMRIHSATSMTVFIADASFGFLAETEYAYVFMYSS